MTPLQIARLQQLAAWLLVVFAAMILVPADARGEGAKGASASNAPHQYVRPAPALRGCDPSGCGHFDASRKNRPHNAYDYYAEPGQVILAPISGEIVSVGRAYPNDPALSAILIVGEGGLVACILYVELGLPLKTRVRAGQPLGVAQDVRRHYPNDKKMRPHVHARVEIHKQTVDAENDPRFALSLGTKLASN